MRLYILLITLLTFSLFICGYAESGTRKALIIGNAAYPSNSLFKRLPNPNNANALSDRLKNNYGFQTILVLNVNQEQMNEKINAFAKWLSKDDVALVYYAGHATVTACNSHKQEQRHYLLPIGHTILSSADVCDYGVSTQWILDRIATPRRSDSINLLFLDTCRDILAETVGGGIDESKRKGYVSAGATGVFISYATAPGDTALYSHTSDYSPYTESLLQNLTPPYDSWPVEMFVKQVGTGVKEIITRDHPNSTQTPWVAGGISGNFCFNTCGSFTANATPNLVTNIPLPDPVKTTIEAASGPKLEEEREPLKTDSTPPHNRCDDLASFPDVAIEKIYTNAAIISCRNAISRYPHSTRFQAWLGRAFFKAGNYLEALKWCRQAAEQGDSYGQYFLGYMYYTGHDVPQDYAEARRWYQKAAEQGNAYAQVNLGYMYDNGYGGVQQDYAEARRWYQKAAEQGNAYAQVNLGYMYYNAKGVLRDYAEARQWYQKAAEQGNADAQLNLGYMYDNGYGGVQQDYAEASRWYQKAAEQGNIDAQNMVVILHKR